MITNKFLDISDITYSSADVLTNSFGFTKTVNREYDDRFARTGAKIGSVTNARLPAQFRFSSGAALDPQALNDKGMPVSLNKLYQRSFAVDSTDMTLSVDDFTGRYLTPAMLSMAAEIDYDGVQSMVKYVGNVVGTPGTAIDDQAELNSTVASARQLLSKNLAPVGEKKFMLGDSSWVSKGSIYNVNVFNPQGSVSAANSTGVVSTWGGFDWFETELAPVHTNGTRAGTLLVNGANQSGSTLTIDGITSGTLAVGDTFTIANVYAVNAQTKETYSHLQQFSVVATPGSGTSQAFTISPEIVGPSDPRQNVSALPADNAAITVLGASAASTQFALAYTKDVMVFATADLDEITSGAESFRASIPELGLSVRVVKQFDIRSNQQLMRIDCLGGWAPLYPQLGVKIATR